MRASNKEIVRRSSTVRVVGTRHSFSRIADTTGTMISYDDMWLHAHPFCESPNAQNHYTTVTTCRLKRMCRVLSIKSDTVTVEGGITYGVCTYIRVCSCQKSNTI